MFIPHKVWAGILHDTHFLWMKLAQKSVENKYFTFHGKQKSHLLVIFRQWTLQHKWVQYWLISIHTDKGLPRKIVSYTSCPICLHWPTFYRGPVMLVYSSFNCNTSETKAATNSNVIWPFDMLDCLGYICHISLMIFSITAANLLEDKI